jgi:uncharacterized protein (DUF433 family)
MAVCLSDSIVSGLTYLASGMTQSEILEDFPYLTTTDILACLSYAADREQKTLTLAA